MALGGVGTLIFSLLLVHKCVSGLLQTELTQWQLASSANVTDGGAQLSTTSGATGAWLNVTGPCTVLACLIQTGLYPELFYGQNLALVDATQFDVPFWYRTTFAVPSSNLSAPTVTLAFHGIGYRANVWLNGQLVANNATVVGTFRYFEFNVTALADLDGSPNVLAIEVFRQHDRSLPSTNHDTDLGVTFVDWAPTPPDSNMGLWRSTWIYVSGPVTTRFPLAAATVAAGGVSANITATIEVTNFSPQASSVLVNLLVLSPDGVVVVNVNHSAALPPASVTNVAFTPLAYPGLHMTTPALWWPWQMGNPAQHSLTFTVYVVDVDTGTASISDAVSAPFGIREITSQLDANGNRLYSVNGLPILIRGAGWSPDLLLRQNDTTTSTNLAYLKDMGLNAVRLEGKMEPDFFFDTCDREGILVLAGWCVGHGADGAFTLDLALHELPPPNVEQLYLDAAGVELWPNPLISAASAGVSNISGSTGVKMSGPYSWVPPSYWETDPGQWGGAWGFVTEGGPGENPMTLESLSRTVPSEELWPPQPDDCWGHCGSSLGMFGNLKRFNGPMGERYGNASSLTDYMRKAAAMVFEGHRAMYEAYSRNKYTNSTGVIQWMLNNAWPENIWHLFDWYSNPGPAYFATKKACEGLHPQYSYDDSSVWVVNSRYTPSDAFGVRAWVAAINGTVLFDSGVVSSPGIPSDAAASITQLPTQADMLNKLGPNTPYFIRLVLANSTGSNLTTNDYWLSTTPDVLEWAQSTFYNTPVSQYGSLAALQTLPPVQLQWWGNQVLYNSTTVRMELTLKNPSTAIAFMVRVRITIPTAAGPQDVVPILWNDNYVTLWSGEARDVTAFYPLASLQGQDTTIQVELWNGVPAATTVVLGNHI